MALHAVDHPLAGESFTSAFDGILLTTVLPDGQAAKLGVARGDVLIGYADAAMRTMDDLRAAVDAHAAGAGPIEVEVVAISGERRYLRCDPGLLGVAGEAVVAGRELRFVPPARPLRFDLERLRRAPLDCWSVFTIAGKHIGYEHLVLRLEGDVLHALDEVAFASEAWGAQHFFQRDRAQVTGSRPRPLWTRHQAADGVWWWEAAATSIDGVDRWRSRTVEGAEEASYDEMLGDTALQDYVASMLPHLALAEPGACLHFRPLIAAQPAPADRLSALICRGEEATTLRDGSQVNAVRWDTVSLGQVTRTLWLRDGQAIRSDYGGDAVAWPGVSRDEALAGVDTALAPVADP